jgi:hypothetical protein
MDPEFLVVWLRCGTESPSRPCLTLRVVKALAIDILGGLMVWRQEKGRVGGFQAESGLKSGQLEGNQRPGSTERVGAPAEVIVKWATAVDGCTKRKDQCWGASW